MLFSWYIVFTFILNDWSWEPKLLIFCLWNSIISQAALVHILVDLWCSWLSGLQNPSPCSMSVVWCLPRWGLQFPPLCLQCRAMHLVFTGIIWVELLCASSGIWPSKMGAFYPLPPVGSRYRQGSRDDGVEEVSHLPRTKKERSKSCVWNSRVWDLFLEYFSLT